jgi:hypothetical protein
MKGRVSKSIHTKHPHPNPPPSRWRELQGIRFIENKFMFTGKEVRF